MEDRCDLGRGNYKSSIERVNRYAQTGDFRRVSFEPHTLVDQAALVDIELQIFIHSY